MTGFEEPRGEASLTSELAWIIRRRWWIVVLACLFGACIGYSLAKSQPKQYAAIAKVLFRDQNVDQRLFSDSVTPSGSSDPARNAATNLRLASLPEISSAAARRIGPAVTASRVRAAIAVASDGPSDLVNIQATDGVPRVSAVIANAYAAELIATRRAANRAALQEATDLVVAQIARARADRSVGSEARIRTLVSRQEQLRVATALQTGNVEIAQVAGVPAEASSPNVRRSTGVGLVFGFLLGALLIAAIERLDRGLRSEREVEQLYGQPLLATVPLSSEFAARVDPEAADEAEPFRLLRARLRYARVDRPSQMILVTSAQPGEGKSTVVYALSRIAAQLESTQDKGVLLVEADLRRPTLARRAGIEGAALGLSDVVAGTCTLDDAIVRLPVKRGDEDTALSMLPAGTQPPNPAEILESDRLRLLLQELRARFSYIVIDTPPVALIADAVPLIAQVDGVILISRLNKTTRVGARHLRDQLGAIDAPVLGVVLNGARGRSGVYGYYSAPAE